VEEQAGRLQRKQEQCRQLEATLKETKDTLVSSEQQREQQEGLHKVRVTITMMQFIISIIILFIIK